MIFHNYVNLPEGTDGRDFFVAFTVIIYICWIDWRYDHGLYLIQLDTFFGFYAFNIESHQTRPRARSGVGVGRTFSGELGPVVVALAHEDTGVRTQECLAVTKQSGLGAAVCVCVCVCWHIPRIGNHITHGNFQKWGTPKWMVYNGKSH